MQKMLIVDQDPTLNHILLRDDKCTAQRALRLCRSPYLLLLFLPLLIQPTKNLYGRARYFGTFNFSKLFPNADKKPAVNFLSDFFFVSIWEKLRKNEKCKSSQVKQPTTEVKSATH
jgi:hypothetical protein